MAKTPKRKKNAKAKKPDRRPGIDVVKGPATEKTHTATGRFKKGNPGGPGNPVWRETHDKREALITAMRSFDPIHVFNVLLAMYIEATTERNTAAAKIFLEYTLGKPTITLALKDPGGMREKLLEFIQQNAPDKEVIKAAKVEDVMSG